jgi:hypothetical protein
MEDLEYPLNTIVPIGNIYTNSSTTFVREYFGKPKPISKELQYKEIP